MAYRIRGARKLQRDQKCGGVKTPAESRPWARLCQPANSYGHGRLPSRLGLVSAANSRFNSYELNDRGKEFLRLTVGRDNTSKAIPMLWSWLGGTASTARKDSKELSLISPMRPLPSPCAGILLWRDGDGWRGRRLRNARRPLASLSRFAGL